MWLIEYKELHIPDPKSQEDAGRNSLTSKQPSKHLSGVFESHLRPNPRTPVRTRV